MRSTPAKRPRSSPRNTPSRNRREGTDRLRVTVADNGPGILRSQIPNVFARLLYGSRFHANRQSRGQQGIGISAAVLSAGLTTARPVRIVSKVEEEEAAHVIELLIDTQKNLPRVLSEDLRALGPPPRHARGALDPRQVPAGAPIPLRGPLKDTAIVNPHARIGARPDRTARGSAGSVPRRRSPRSPRSSRRTRTARARRAELPAQGLEPRSTLSDVLGREFAGITPRARAARGPRQGYPQRSGEAGVDQRGGPRAAARGAARGPAPAPERGIALPDRPRAHQAGPPQRARRAPARVLRPPGQPPAQGARRLPLPGGGGAGLGGDLPSDQQVQILRFANRVPLLFQQGACAITTAIAQMDWRRYGLDQKGGSGVPVGPALLLVHLASTKIPFTSEAKEAIADDPEIGKELTLALQAAARHLRIHLSRRSRREQAGEKFEVILEDPAPARREDEPPRRKAGPGPHPRDHQDHGRRPRRPDPPRPREGVGALELPGRGDELYAPRARARAVLGDAAARARGGRVGPRPRGDRTGARTGVVDAGKARPQRPHPGHLLGAKERRGGPQRSGLLRRGRRRVPPARGGAAPRRFGTCGSRGRS